MTEPLVQAIRERRVVEFDYEQCHRVVEPHTLGYVMVRNFVLETIRTKDTHAFNSIIDRVDGKVKERFELGGEGGEPSEAV